MVFPIDPDGAPRPDIFMVNSIRHAWISLDLMYIM